MSRRALTPDLSPREAARTLGLPSADDLGAALKAYRAHGLPAPDPDPVTGRFDPVAWERFRRLRNPMLFPELTAVAGARDPAAAARERRGRRCGAAGA